MPLHELMQAAHVAHQLVPGAQVEMISVAQHERCIDLLEVFRGQGLDRRLGTHRGKHWCREVAMRSSKDSRACPVVFGGNVEFKHAANYTVETTLAIQSVKMA